jgi:serine protease Do
LGNEGVGFAIPIDLARRVMEQLIHSGKVTRGYLGVYPADITPELAQSFNLPDQNGALVNDVAPNSPAQKAGIQSGDVIVEFNGKRVTDTENFSLAVSECSPGTTATVKVIRDGHEKTFTVKLGELLNQVSQNQKSQNENSSASNTDALDGVTVSDLDQQARQQLNIPDNVQGALVTDVDSNSNSAEAGLQQGDVITEINHQPVANADDAVKLCTLAKTSNILLKVWRHNNGFGATLYIAVDNTKQTE